MANHGRGWVRVRAENRVDNILDALKSGAFYSSCGPVIEDFTVEHGVATLRCSPVQKIWFRSGEWPTHTVYQGEGVLTQGTYRVQEGISYLRAIVMDAEGRRAWTNPIFFDR
jgi:hypothetical protein